MSANQAAFPVAVMARVLGVSKAGFYAWRERAPSARQVADGALGTLDDVAAVLAHAAEQAGRPGEPGAQAAVLHRLVAALARRAFGEPLAA